jgi:methionyl aminopeptidase
MTVRTKEEKDRLFRAGRIVVTILSQLKEYVKPGTTTWDLEMKARSLLEKFSAQPAFLGYMGYPAVLCVSVNEQVVHGIPSKDKVLKEGDLVSIDFGVEYKGFFADAAITVPVQYVDEEGDRLLRTALKALYEGIQAFQVGNRIGDVGHSIEKVAKKEGYGVVREFVGHGIGRDLHEDPRVPNYGEPGTGPLIEEGMVVAIEPMLIEGGEDGVEVLKDGWTVVTKDRSRSVHVEHMVMATRNGPRVVTEGLPLYGVTEGVL